MAVQFKNNEELPVTLNGRDVAAALNISKAGAYKLMSTEGFPTIRIGKSVRVPKDAFLKWINENTGKNFNI